MPIPRRATWTPASAALFILCGWLVVGSLWPFIPVPSLGDWARQCRFALSWRIGEPVINTLVERALSLIPLGFLTFRVIRRRRPARALRRAAGLTCTGILVLEALQTIVHARHARITDAALGFLAALIGILLAARCPPRVEGIIPRGLRFAKRLGLAPIGIAGLALSAGIAYLHLAAGLQGWDRGYPLVLANEATLDRPWRGRLFGVAIYPRALAASEVARLATLDFSPANNPLRRAFDPAALYGLDRLSVSPEGAVRPRAGATAPALRVHGDIASIRQLDECLEVIRPAALISERAAAGLAEEITRAEAISIETLFAPADIDQSGPARIISFAVDPFHCNFTLAQARTALVVRLRTPVMGDNGTRVPFGTRTGTIAARPHHVVVTFANGTLRIYVDGREPWRPLHLYWPSSVLMRGTWAAGGITLAALLFFPLGLAAGWIQKSRRAGPALGLGLLLAAVPPILTAIAFAAALHRQHEPRFLISIAVCTLLGTWAGRRIGPDAD